MAPKQKGSLLSLGGKSFKRPRPLQALVPPIERISQSPPPEDELDDDVDVDQTDVPRRRTVVLGDDAIDDPVIGETRRIGGTSFTTFHIPDTIERPTSTLPFPPNRPVETQDVPAQPSKKESPPVFDCPPEIWSQRETHPMLLAAWLNAYAANKNAQSQQQTALCNPAVRAVLQASSRRESTDGSASSAPLNQNPWITSTAVEVSVGITNSHM